MANRYHIINYRPAECDNEECARHGQLIPFATSYVREMEVGSSWRTFCPECGDGAGWTLTKVEYVKDINVDEVVLEIKIQLPMDLTPVGNGLMTPYWQNDCDDCVWLGSTQCNEKLYDFYYCENKAGKEAGLDRNLRDFGIIRTGNAEEAMEIHSLNTILNWKKDDSNQKYDVCCSLQKRVVKYLEKLLGV
jgi:hypothetical protein